MGVNPLFHRLSIQILFTYDENRIWKINRLNGVVVKFIVFSHFMIEQFVVFLNLMCNLWSVINHKMAEACIFYIWLSVTIQTICVRNPLDYTEPLALLKYFPVNEAKTKWPPFCRWHIKMKTLLGLIKIHYGCPPPFPQFKLYNVWYKYNAIQNDTIFIFLKCTC